MACCVSAPQKTDTHLHRDERFFQTAPSAARLQKPTSRQEPKPTAAESQVLAASAALIMGAALPGNVQLQLQRLQARLESLLLVLVATASMAAADPDMPAQEAVGGLEAHLLPCLDLPQQELEKVRQHLAESTKLLMQDPPAAG